MDPNDFVGCWFRRGPVVLKFASQQLSRVEHQLEPNVAHFEHTRVGLVVNCIIQRKNV
jgi:hypothetical protein